MADIVQSIGLPPDDTVAVFRAKGYLPAEYRQRWDGIWHDEHARWFTVTKLFNNAVLEDVRRSLDDVLSKGGTFEQWRADLLPKLRAGSAEGGVDPRLLTSAARLRVVYDTNLRMSRAAGQWKRIQALKARRPYLMYDAVNDGHTRPLHRLWGGLDDGKPIILHADHPAWAFFYPPCGWGCRCGVIQLSERDLKRLGLRVTTDAELIAKGWLSKAGVIGGEMRSYSRPDGEVVKVPAGIDPGFAYNPGKAYLSALTPPPVDGGVTVPRLLPAGSEPPPMPPPRPMPATEILPPDVQEEEVVTRFMGAFGLRADEQRVIYDELGEPVAISREMMLGAEGRPKTHKQGRQSYPLLAARALLEPDEIWHGWVEEDPARIGKTGRPFPARLRRRYIARFVIDGHPQTVMVAVDLGRDGWKGVTWFHERQEGYFDRTVRQGVLVWRRGQPETTGGPAT